MTTEPQDELISVRQAAKESGRNPETVRRWIWNGRLPAEKLGNQLFVKRRALEAFKRETGPEVTDKALKPDFLERAIALQNRIKARGAEAADAGLMVQAIRMDRWN